MKLLGSLRKGSLYFVLLLLLGLSIPIAVRAAHQPENNILVIHSYNPELSWTQQEKSGIDKTFEDSRHTVNIYHEFLDAKRYPELEHGLIFLEYLQKKYQDTDLKLLIVADDPGLDLVLATRDTYFPELPLVFMGLNNIRQELFNIPWITGVFETHSFEEILIEAKKQTDVNNALIVTDSTATGKANQQRIEAATENNSDSPKITIIKDLNPNDIVEKIDKYPNNWPIILAGQLRADQGNKLLISFEETVELLRSQVKNPIYTDSIMHVGRGAVGGKVLEGSHHAQQAVQLAEQVLDGIPIDQIEMITNSKNQWVFDIEELQRFNISPDALPVGSILINQELSFYEQYRQLVWYVLSIFIFGILTILILLDAIRRQKQAEITLEHRVAERTNELSQALQELKQTQAQLIQTEKLSSLGQLVGGIAHEFNNPLTFIAGNIDILKGYGKDLLDLISLYQEQTKQDASSKAHLYSQDIDLAYIQKDMSKILQSMTNGTERIETIVRSLQDFACSDEQGVKPTDLNKSLDNTLLILKSRIGNDIQINKDYTNLPLVYCDPGAINQVFMQVLLNAIEAVNSPSKRDPRQIMIQTCLQEQNWATISIKDTGPGINLSIRENIFDPFFSTKPVGQGTGLGLAVAYQYIQQHQGHLTFQPNSPQGSIFIIQLPILESR